LVNARPIAAWYGGTFDPPHAGHQQIVAYLAAQPWIDTVIVTPAWRNPFKGETSASPRQRLAWCQKVFADPKVVVDAGEIEAERSVYTAQTLARLRDRYDIRYIAIGSDNLASLERWHAFETLNAAVTWLVFEREGYAHGDCDILRSCRRIPLDAPVSSTAIRNGEALEYLDERIAPQVHDHLNKGDT
jgi:nicotinate-nucleotide adenylyltransferase